MNALNVRFNFVDALLNASQVILVSRRCVTSSATILRRIIIVRATS